SGEIDRAARGDLPRLVEAKDLRGDLHVHTEWSDGVHTIREMAEAARARGLDYVAISDHSVGRANAQGLTPERLRAQIAAGRDAVEFDAEAVLQAAARTGTAIEINAQPSRLDLNDTLARRARELGVKLVISSDSHASSHFDVLPYGVSVARRAGCTAEDILN